MVFPRNLFVVGCAEGFGDGTPGASDDEKLTGVSLAQVASEPRGNTVEGFKDFNLQVKARFSLKYAAFARQRVLDAPFVS